MSKNSKTPAFIQNLNRGQKITFSIIIVIIVLAVVYSITTLILRSGKIAVEVFYAPYSAKITLNDVSISNKKTSYLTAGNYHLKVEAEHFTIYEEDIEISDFNNKIVGILQASDAEGEEYVSKNALEFTNAEGIVGEYLSEQGSKIKDKYPILKHLPYNNSLYSLSYSYEEKNNNPVLTIKAQDKVLDTAIAKLKDYASAENDSLINYIIHFSGNNNPYLTPTKTSTANNPLDFIKESYAADGTNRIVYNGSQIGDYYVATIQDYDFDSDLYLAHYRIVIKKHDASWKIISYPQPYLTKNNTPDVPDEVLNTANSL